MDSPSILVCLLLFSLFSSNQCLGSAITELNDDNWQLTLFDNWMILFCSSWNPACNYFIPEWNAFAGWSNDYTTRVGFVNFTANPGLAARFLVTKIPTIVHSSNGVYREIDGEIVNLRYRDLIKFVDYKKRWQNYHHFPQYRLPNTFWMTIFSDLIHFAMTSKPLRDFHEFLVRKYFLPFSLFYFLTPIYYIILCLFYYIFIRLFLIITNVFPQPRPKTLIALSKAQKLNRRFFGNSQFMGKDNHGVILRKHSSEDCFDVKAKKCKKESTIPGDLHKFRRSLPHFNININDLEIERKRHLDDCYSDYDDYSHEPRRKSKIKYSDHSSASSRDNSSENPAHCSTSCATRATVSSRGKINKSIRLIDATLRKLR